MERCWSVYEKFADKHFLHEMATSETKLHQRFWEMYLGAVLLDGGLSLSRTNGRGPDFGVDHDTGRIWIEAAAPEKGDAGRPDSVPEPLAELLQFDANGIPRPLDGPGYTPDERTIKLRYLGTIKEKSEKFESYLAHNIVSRDEKLVLAINSANIRVDQPSPLIPVIARACFGLGKLFIRFPLGVNNPGDETRGYHSEL